MSYYYDDELDDMTVAFDRDALAGQAGLEVVTFHGRRYQHLGMTPLGRLVYRLLDAS